MYTKFVIIVILVLSCDHILGQSNFDAAISKSAQLLEKVSKDNSIPGIVAGVNINGTLVWSQALGHIDVENDVRNRVDSVWRVASISKSLTTTLVARLIDEGRLDLNKSINEYLKPSIFPVKQWNKKNVTITLGQVMSHTAGLHITDWPGDFIGQSFNYKNVTETIASFKNEPLHFEPGTNSSYTNYGFQIVGAIIESILNETYENAVNEMFRQLEMKTTFCERREQIIPHRARYYILNPSITEKPKLINTVIYDDLVSFGGQLADGGHSLYDFRFVEIWRSYD